MRQRPSKPSIVQKSQSQRTQFSWACTGLRTFERDNLAVFRLSNVSQRTKTCDRDSERPTAEDGAIEGDRRPCKFISETSANDKGRDSVSSYQKNSSNNESDSADKDRSQDQSYTTNNSTDNQNVQDGHSDNEDGGGAEGSQDHDAEHAKINKLIEKIEKSLETRRKILDEHTQSWIHSLWGYIDFITPAQWDFDSLLDSAESDPFRIVLHKLRLHWNLKARTEQGALHGCASNRYIRQYKNEMIRESPSFRALDSRRQEAKRRLFELYLRQGEVFDRMCLLCPGLVGLVAPILTTLEYIHLSFDVNVLIYSTEHKL